MVFEFHSDQVLDEKNISEDEVKSRSYNSRSGDTEYYAPETINKYIDLAAFLKTLQSNCFLKNMKTFLNR